jgi:alkylhydroperoxidase family enzyme
MSRISIPSVEDSPAASKPLLDAVKKQLGVVPNLMKLVANSPAALQGYLALNGAVAKGTLNAQLRERIALAVAQYNGYVNNVARTDIDFPVVTAQLAA